MSWRQAVVKHPAVYGFGAKCSKVDLESLLLTKSYDSFIQP